MQHLHLMMYAKLFPCLPVIFSFGLIGGAPAAITSALTDDIVLDTRASGPVVIPDPALLAALRTALAKPTGDITVEDMLTLTTLRIAGLGITDLTGLQAATNLRVLDIRRNNFTDAAALWTVLDQITPMYCLYVDVRRPGNDPAGLIVETLVDTTGNSFFILVDAPNLPTLDFNSLNVSASNPANLEVLRVISEAGVEVQSDWVNIPPYASASATITNASTRTVTLNPGSGDVDGYITSYLWSWSGGSSSESNPSITLPYGATEVALTVTDNDRATATSTTTVILVPPVDSDRDSDGIDDLLEFAFNLNMEQADHHILTEGTGTSGLPSVRLDASQAIPRLRMEYLQRRDSVTTGIFYQPQWTSEFGMWSSGSADMEVIAIDDTWERVIVYDPMPGARRFGRMRVSRP